MKYQAVLTYDYARTRKADDQAKWTEENNAYEELKRALVQLGWQWRETSAFTIDTDDLSLIWRGAALVARQADRPGELSALSLVLQGGEVKTPSSLTKGKSALRNIEDRPFPY
jgi:hypothetical protein